MVKDDMQTINAVLDCSGEILFFDMVGMDCGSQVAELMERLGFVIREDKESGNVNEYRTL